MGGQLFEFVARAASNLYRELLSSVRVCVCAATAGRHQIFLSSFLKRNNRRIDRNEFPFGCF